MESYKNINFLILKIVTPILLLTGMLGFVIPDEYGLMNTSTYYNIFHIIAGIIGAVFLIKKDLKLVRIFNIVFGSMDLYQVLASFLNIFPNEFIGYTATDDILHVVIGIALILIGIVGKETIEEPEEIEEEAR